MSKVNWGVLYAEWRCHSIGRSWTEEELNAVYKLKVPVKYVRMWILTTEEYESIKDLPFRDEATIKAEAIENEKNALLEAGKKAREEAVAKIEKEEAEKLKSEAIAKELAETKAKEEAEAKAKEEAEIETKKNPVKKVSKK